MTTSPTRLYTLAEAFALAKRKFPRTGRGLVTYLVRDRRIPLARAGNARALTQEGLDKLMEAIESYFAKPEPTYIAPLRPRPRPRPGKDADTAT